MRSRLRATAIVAATLAAAGVGLSSASAAPSRTGDRLPGESAPVAVPAAGTFYPTDPQRLLGTDDAGYAMPSGTSVSVPVAGRAGLPEAGVSAVMVNVTATSGTLDSSLSFAPSPGGASTSTTGRPARPLSVPLVVVPAGAARSTLLTLPIGTGGGLQVAAAGGDTSVTADVVGFYAADDTVVAARGVSGGYQPVPVTRVLDTDRSQPLAAKARQVLSVDLGASVNPHTTALLLRVASKGASAAGSLGVAAAGAPTLGSAVSFAAGSVASNLALVPVNTDGPGDGIDIALTNASTGATGVEVDLVGFYDDGRLGPNLRFRPLPQTRVVDTAAGLGTSALQPGRRASAVLAPAVVGASTFGLVGVVSTSPPVPASLSVGADAASSFQPAVPVAAGRSSVAVQPQVGSSGGLDLAAGSATAPVEITLDVTGSFEAYPPVVTSGTRSWVAPVSAWQISAVSR